MLNTERLISEDEAYNIVVAILLAKPVVGARPTSSEGPLHLEYQRGAGVGCSLSVSFGGGRREEARARRNAPVEEVMVQPLRVEIGWSSTSRSVAGAVAALALYREVTELAAMIEARLESEVVGFRVDRAAEQSEEAR